MNRDGVRSGFNRGVVRDGTADGTIRNTTGNTERVAPRHRAVPPVRSMPRANRIPATRIPLR
jgi:hypothetical protein